MKFKLLSLAGIAVAMYTLPALAHHSFSMFDPAKKTTLEGTVKEFLWTNPHSWIQLMVPDEKGTPQLWSIEMGPPGALALLGWRPKTLEAGYKVTVLIHPNKDGSHGGQFLLVTLPNGESMKTEYK